jgi:hypothetical protein
MSDSKFCPFGANILQNMQDNIQSRKCRLPQDELEATTSVPKCENTSEDNCYTDEQGDLAFENAGSFDEYDYEQLVEHGSEEDDVDDSIILKRNLNNLKKLHKGKGQIGYNAVINSRADVNGCLFEQSSADQLHNSIDETPGNSQATRLGGIGSNHSYILIFFLLSVGVYSTTCQTQWNVMSTERQMTNLQLL